MNYWIFKANPKKYDIDSRLRDPEPKTTWQITRYRDEIYRGDRVFAWRTYERKDRPFGIVALLEIDSDPAEMDEIEFEYRYYRQPKYTRQYYVLMHYLLRLKVLSSHDLKTINGLENLSTFHGYQAATNFPVTHAEATILLGLIAKQPVIVPTPRR
jgi:predicted RNA-binding protein with PUA-like domain